MTLEVGEVSLSEKYFSGISVIIKNERLSGEDTT